MASRFDNNIWCGRVFRYAPIFIWIGVIFFASTTNGSMSETSRFVRPFLEFVFPGTPESTLKIYHAYIRKFAHLFEYAVLALFASRAFLSSGKQILRKYWYLFTFALILLIAAIDETNQSFNPMRTASFYDVLIDCSGGILMILFVFLFRMLLHKNRTTQVVK